MSKHGNVPSGEATSGDAGGRAAAGVAGGAGAGVTTGASPAMFGGGARSGYDPCNNTSCPPTQDTLPPTVRLIRGDGK